MQRKCAGKRNVTPDAPKHAIDPRANTHAVAAELAAVHWPKGQCHSQFRWFIRGRRKRSFAMRISCACAIMLLPAVLPFGTAVAGPLSGSIGAGTTAAGTFGHPSGLRDVAEKKGGPKWCQKHPRKCAKMGGPLPP